MEQGFGDPAELRKAAGSCLPGCLGVIQPPQRSASAPSTSHTLGHHTDCVWGGSGMTWLQRSPALWLGLCLVTNGDCRAGDAPDSQRPFCLRRAHTVIVPVPDSVPLHTLLIFPGQ